MIILDFLLPNRHLLTNDAITAAQKILFVLLVAVSLWNGYPMESLGQYLMPSKPLNSYFNIFSKAKYYADSDDCFHGRFIWTVLTPNCTRRLVFRRESDAYQAALNLSTSTRWQYLLILRSLQFLAPYVFAMSAPLLIPIIYDILEDVVMSVLNYCSLGYIWRHEDPRIARSNLRKTFENLIFIGVGFSLASLAVCLYLPICDKGVKQVCETKACMFCFTRLMDTLFRDATNPNSYYQAFESSSRKFMMSAMMYVTTAVLESLLFASTVLLVCLILYITLDACKSAWNFGKSVGQYLPIQFTGNDIHTPWNSVKNLMPWRGGGDGAR